jgi:hypothetical protein
VINLLEHRSSSSPFLEALLQPRAEKIQAKGNFATFFSSSFKKRKTRQDREKEKNVKNNNHRKKHASQRNIKK